MWQVLRQAGKLTFKLLSSQISPGAGAALAELLKKIPMSIFYEFIVHVDQTSSAPSQVDRLLNRTR